MERATASTSAAASETHLDDWQRQRAHACRLTPDRALQTLEEAQAFLAERGMLTLTPSCALPSLFGACHEEPYQPGGHGFAAWPKTKWWWGSALAARPGVYTANILRGKRVFLSEATAALVDPLCRAELARAEGGAYGPAAQELVAFLAAAGASRLDDIKSELGLDSAALRSARAALERVGAVVSRSITVEAMNDGERQTSELARWDHWFPEPAESAPRPLTEGEALAALIVAGVGAAVIAPKNEIGRWFSWPVSARQVADLIATGTLYEPSPGWVIAAANAQ